MGCIRLLRLALLPLAITVLGSCGGYGTSTVAVTAREYRFQGLPASMSPGVTIFTVENKGGEVHELHLFELAEGVTTVAELLGRPQDESMEKLTSVGRATAYPAGEASLNASLDSGRYAAVCLIPVGAKPGSGYRLHDLEDMVFDPNADTHFRRGMYADFAVGQQPG